MKFLLYICISLVSTFGFTYLFCKLNDLKIKSFSFKTWFIFLLGVIFVTFIRFYDIQYISTISYFFFYPILFYSISKFNYHKLFIISLIVWIYGIILDFSSMLVIAISYYCFKFNVNTDIFKIVPSIYVLIMFIILGRAKFMKKVTNKIYEILSKVRYSDFMLIIFAAFIFVVGIILALNIRNINIGFLACIILILVMFIFVILLKAKYIDIENRIFIQTLKENNSFYISISDEYSLFRHNLIAKLLSVESVSNKKAKILIDELIKDFNKNIDYNRLILDLPYGLDGVINQKLSGYNDILNIKISNSLEHDLFDVLSPKRYNVLVEKLVVSLDNAIEASFSSVDKVLVINLMEDNNSIKIQIKNTFSGGIDIDNIGKVHYSTKGKEHGFGLYSILRNNEVSTNVKIINKFFVSEIVAKYNKNIIKK